MDAAEENPDASFVVIGGDKAAVSGLTNYYNGYTDIYEARYLSGVVAGMKLAQLHKKGKISKYGYNQYHRVRVGYIATYPNAEAISGYSAFYLGMKSVMKNVALEVYYTNTWMDMDAEATAADKMIRSGCVLIAQQSDSTSVAETIEKAWKKGRHVYYIGGGRCAYECNQRLECLLYAAFYGFIGRKRFRAGLVTGIERGRGIHYEARKTCST